MNIEDKLDKLNKELNKTESQTTMSLKMALSSEKDIDEFKEMLATIVNIAREQYFDDVPDKTKNRINQEIENGYYDEVDTFLGLFLKENIHKIDRHYNRILGGYELMVSNCFVPENDTIEFNDRIQNAFESKNVLEEILKDSIENKNLKTLFLPTLNIVKEIFEIFKNKKVFKENEIHEIKALGIEFEEKILYFRITKEEPFSGLNPKPNYFFKIPIDTTWDYKQRKEVLAEIEKSINSDGNVDVNSSYYERYK